MAEDDSTCWTLIEGAAAGREEDRETFARVYLPVVRRYLQARWRGNLRRHELDDAVQEVFVECLKPSGALGRVTREDQWGFRAYLYGVTRNMARSFEGRRRKTPDLHSSEEPDRPAGPDSELGRLFDREFARAILAETLRRWIVQAESEDDAALQRVELLRLRFDEERPIREIAREWCVDAAHLHHQYARARREFRRVLREVLIEHAGSNSAVREEDLLELVTGDG